MSADPLPARRAADSYTEMVQVVLPNDANPLGFALGGTVMHYIDLVGAIAAHRHTRRMMVTAAVDGLQFLHPIAVGDLIVLHAHVTATFRTSLEVAVDVSSESVLTGERRRTSMAYLTFATFADGGERALVPPLVHDTEEGRQGALAANARRAARLQARPAQQP